MLKSFIFIFSLMAGFSSFAQNEATPVTSNRSAVPVNVTATLVSSSSNPNTNETPTTTIPNIGVRELYPVNVIATQVSNNNTNTQLRTSHNSQVNTAVPNAVILKTVPQAAVAKRVDENKEANKPTNQNK